MVSTSDQLITKNTQTDTKFSKKKKWLATGKTPFFVIKMRLILYSPFYLS